MIHAGPHAQHSATDKAQSAFVDVKTDGALGLITLDRPEVLNALDLGMIRAIAAALDRFEADDSIAHVAIRSAHRRAFCAGGDLRGLYEARMAAGEAVSTTFFREEYRLNHRIHTFPKPYVALVDGIVMGGGAGISVPGRLRVFGNAVRFAMPEVGIGFFPDVGATWFLPRLEGAAGPYLALTGSTVNAADCLWCGLATHRLESDDFDALIAALTQSDDAEATVDRHCSRAGDPDCDLSRLLQSIGPAFPGVGVADAVAALERLAAHDPLAATAHEAMARAAPLSLAIADRQMRIGGTLDFAQCLRTEFRIVSRVVAGYDLYEGIRARLIDRDNRPVWRPGRLAEIADRDVARFFDPLARELDLA